jgi:uncharacterized repeat protein (TIGR02543 family)
MEKRKIVLLRNFILALVLCLVLSFVGCRNGLSDGDSNPVIVGNSSISGTISKSANPSVRANGLPAANAKVWLEQRPDLFAFTDAAGKYIITGVPTGVFKVVVRFSQGTTVFKIRSVDTSVKHNENKNCDLTVVEAKNKVKGTLKNEDGSNLAPGTKLYLWGEEFVVQEDGSFETPPLPDFQNIEDAINEIIVNFGLPSQIKLPMTFGRGGQTQKVEFFVPATPARVDLLPRVSLINVSAKTNEDGVFPNTNSTVRAIFFPENPEKIEWEATKGTLGQDINVSGTQIERIWTAPENAGVATITVSVTNAGKTVKAALPILIKGTPKYSIAYSGNGNTGGEVPVDSSTYIEGATVTVKGNENTLEKTGFTFNGWNTKADGTGTAYAAGAELKVEKADITLFAQWVVQSTETYSITYVGNGNTGGDVPTDANKYPENATVTVKQNSGNLVKTGFTFVGWNTKADASGTDYAADATFKMSAANIELFAKWSAQTTYKVTYNGNGNTGGDVPTDTNNYLENADVTVKQNSGNLVKAGFTFVGWNTKADATGTDYAADATFKMSAANIELFAKWSAQTTYKVTYNGNGNTSGDVPTDTNNYLENADVTVKQNSGNLVKTGFTFVGWNTKADATGTDYAADATFKMSAANIELFAKWSALPTYKVTYNGNGNTGGDVPADANNYLENADVTVKQNSGNLVKTGFTFVGWNTKADATGTDYTADATFKMSAANIELFAKWKINKFNLVYQAGSNGSIIGSLSQRISYGADGTAVTATPAAGYKFTGWSDSKTEASRTDTNITADKTLTATFAAISAEVNSANKYAWSENAGWISFSNSTGKVSAKLGENGYLTGFAWSENVGWIKFAHDPSVVPFANTSATNWGVNVAADGKLSGYAWSENAGWIKFGTSHSETAINLTNGEMSGYAWSENLGWISLKGSNYKVQFDL